MIKFKLKQNESILLTSQSGLVFIGAALKHFVDVDQIDEKFASAGIATSDIIRSYVGLLQRAISCLSARMRWAGGVARQEAVTRDQPQRHESDLRQQRRSAKRWPHTYTWNATNQLSGISGGVTASFQYDAFGRRLSKTVSGTQTGYVYDGLNFVQEKSGASVTAKLLTGLGIDETYTRTSPMRWAARLPSNGWHGKRDQ